ncbi:MFS transporter [Serratia sp. DD3]|uniref:MFS transporter n=1 Tax=Serratia sp. DD3 TaxID=1410619 RepID=UPI0003C5295C|nr:MFS transporter [Serratia sp. DD3]KEY60914.1 inner membrane metabolite transport protein YhjE [Serratia sp. DD3]
MAEAKNSGESKKQSSLLRVTLASLAGTTLEFYDHFIYGTAAALVFPAVFFSQVSTELALLMSLVTYGIAFVTRPLGAVIFGHFGDRFSRKNMLVLALLLMGGATFLIGCLPAYGTAGIWGAVGLCLLRLLQGLALGGEWGGAALMVNEFAAGSKVRAFLGSMVQLASPIGFLIASGVFAVINAVLPPEDFIAWGWRIPFLASGLLVAIGFYVRRSIDESPEFVANKQVLQQRKSIPIIDICRNHWRTLLLAIGSRIGSDIAFYVFALFLLVYLPFIGLDKQIALNASIAASIGQAIGIPVFGYLADKFTTRAVISCGALANIAWGFIFFMLVDMRDPTIIVLTAFVALFLLAAMWAPLAAHMPAMFPVHVRFTGAGLGFQTAGIFGGALAPSICLYLIHQYHSSLPVSIYLGAALALAFVCVVMTKPAMADVTESKR